MLTLHDVFGSDPSHVQAIAEPGDEDFALFDYVQIQQTNGKTWVGQLVQPNLNIPLVGTRLQPTILHGLE